MPIQTPLLDDLRFDRVVEELRLRIPVHTPEWTDHNDSDPGITLLQLFAHLAELTGYRLNQIPEKNHIELLKLLGVRLRPAHAARTELAFMLADPSTAESFNLPKSSRVRATEGSPPPAFETHEAIDIVPAEPSVLITTESPQLCDVGTLAPGVDPPGDGSDNEFLTVIWDGKEPKLKDLPIGPIPLFPRPAQKHLWIGISLNPGLSAGFLGARVRLTIQFDDDEQPKIEGGYECRERRWFAESAPLVDWLYYFDADAKEMRRVPGRIDDDTDHLARSGSLRFTVPLNLGAIPADMFRNLREPSVPSALQGCAQLGTALGAKVAGFESADDTIKLTELKTALTSAVDGIQAQAVEAKPAIPHPLDPKLRDPTKVGAWLRLDLPATVPADWKPPLLRMATFNAASASHATAVVNELLGTTTGRAGQSFALVNGNILGEVILAIQEEVNGPMITWHQVESLDSMGPHDRVFELDAEGGVVLFGNGHRGRIPPLVPRGGNVVALSYQHGGGRSGELGVGAITALESPRAGLSSAVNFVAARGGRDPETLAEAKYRARKELSTRHRAVTASDFQFIAKQTPGVRVGRVEVVPLRRPLPLGTRVPLPRAILCGETLPAGPAGLRHDLTAHGAVSLVVVPDLPDRNYPEPVPTPSFLRTVCEHVDKHRLVTTEVHVVPPQYLRLCKFLITVRAEPGYTRTQVQILVEESLTNYLHVLKGGDDGAGFPFGGQLHIADLIALVLRTEGVSRVETLTASFSRTKVNIVPRQGRLVLCRQSADEYERIDLAPEENVSVDLGTVTLSTVA